MDPVSRAFQTAVQTSSSSSLHKLAAGLWAGVLGKEGCNDGGIESASLRISSRAARALNAPEVGACPHASSPYFVSTLAGGNQPCQPHEHRRMQSTSLASRPFWDSWQPLLLHNQRPATWTQSAIQTGQTQTAHPPKASWRTFCGTWPKAVPASWPLCVYALVSSCKPCWHICLRQQRTWLTIYSRSVLPCFGSVLPRKHGVGAIAGLTWSVLGVDGHKGERA